KLPSRSIKSFKLTLIVLPVIMPSKKSYRVLCLKKFQEELSLVSFHPMCENLAKKGFFQVTGLSVVLIPALNSMTSLVFFVEKQLEKLEGEEEDKLWESFLRALYVENADLAFNIALECDKSVYHIKEDSSKNVSPNGAITPRIVIGSPTGFRHIASGSGASTAENRLLNDEDIWKL
ncbi:unnamed protein product, partial [Allacma fusca]